MIFIVVLWGEEHFWLWLNNIIMQIADGEITKHSKQGKHWPALLSV